MVLPADQLRMKLRQLGLSQDVVNAAWPNWWSDEAASSLSATAELSYTVARRLGLSPSSLIEDQPRFVWHDVAKFKNLEQTLSENDIAAITSFGQVVGRATIKATVAEPVHVSSAAELRRAILAGSETVNLASLVTMCWAFGIPVAQLKKFPLSAKRMHAMSVSHQGTFAILLGHESTSPSRVAFTLAHELGHIVLNHLNDGPAVIDMEGLDTEALEDSEEQAANEFALTLLTGQPDFEVFGVPSASPRELAREAGRLGDELRIDPGAVVLGYGRSSGSWDVVALALRALGQGRTQVSTELNALAESQLDWERLSQESSQYLRLILGLENDRA
ncbi:ImmA/IrrE family metallo-endopeptidase [Aeromicrobium sp. S22]|uniref:ImmA/IrrE family metallo-endopeptidase n=1 Tax=Aeromicrobium sp. S22 TaxID=2662029 RepID=UPI00129EFB7C|nr:ImmA/IrrE family metallo-endopeptidase [Aeromicrobium sp. S22]MRK01962.1 ImmA/IrrE family metallo-endopeptidase [Aeromicrobium sp. S22]